jgi:hypothetical protein
VRSGIEFAVATTVWGRSRKLSALVFLAVALAQCTSGTEPGGDPPPGTPGTVTYRLVSPNVVEGALLVSAPAAAVLAAPGGGALTEVITQRVGDVIYIAVVHRFGIDGLTFDLEVADVDSPPELTLVEVVGPDDHPRALAGYALEVLP